MSDLRIGVRRPRADAIRSRQSLLEAAIRVFARDPEADLARVAAVAGLSRQTLYVHFGSRARLLDAVVAHITDRATSLLREARLDEGTATDALGRFLDLFDRLPKEWLRVAAHAAEGDDAATATARHEPVTAALSGVVRRGQEAGEFTTEAPTIWLVQVVIALGHTAYELETAGAVTGEQGKKALRDGLARVLAA